MWPKKGRHLGVEDEDEEVDRELTSGNYHFLETLMRCLSVTM
jgi:hypothetical protein